MAVVELFTDGGCTKEKDRLCGASAFIIRERNANILILDSLTYKCNMDNNVAEAKAIEHGLERILTMYNPKKLVLRIITDSEFAIRVITSQFREWEKIYNSTGTVPKNSRGKTIKSFYIFKNIFFILDRFKSYKMIKIKSHLPMSKFVNSYKEFITSNNIRISAAEYHQYLKFNTRCDTKVKECLKNRLSEASLHESDNSFRK